MNALRAPTLAVILCSTGCITASKHLDATSVEAQDTTRAAPATTREGDCPDGAVPTGWWPAEPSFGEGALEQGCLLQLDEHKRGRHGRWRVKSKDGAVLSVVTWERGAKTGPAVWFYPSGKKQEEGTYKENRRDGAFTWWREDGTVDREARFERDREVVTLQCPEGAQPKDSEDARRCETAAGVPQGPWVSWHPNGLLAEQGQFKDGEPFGPSRSWYPSGQLAREGEYLAGGLPTGRHRTWNESGALQQDAQYDASGRLVALSQPCEQWFEALDGHLRYAFPYEGGVEAGKAAFEDVARGLPADLALSYELRLDGEDAALAVVATGKKGTQVEGDEWRMPLATLELEHVRTACHALNQEGK